MSDLENPTPSAGTTATPPQAEPAADAGTVQPSGEAAGEQSASVEESFTSINPNTLPPQLRPAYDNMLRDYKTKTTRLSETVKSETAKAVEAFKEKAELYDKVITNEEFVKQWNEYVQKVNAQTSADENDPVVKLNKEVQQLKAVALKGEAIDAINMFANAVDEKGQKVHSDFDKLNSVVVDEIAEGNGNKRAVTLLGIAIDISPGNTTHEKIANGYKSAKKVYDAIFEEGKKAGLGRLQTKVLNSTQPPSSMPPVATSSRRPKNAYEALQFAKQGLAVHTD
jgi:hypothetical protein